MASPRNPEFDPQKTLVSWKEIAAFLNRAERTVKRWERERGLPVHRVPGGERGGVYAYPSELKAWLIRDEQAQAERDDVETEGEGEASAATEAELNPHPFGDVAPVAAKGWIRTWMVWAAAATVVTGIVTGVLLRGHLTAAATSAGTGVGKLHHSPSKRAESLYLQGRFQWSLRTPDGLAKSIDEYTQAIVEDPEYALAYAGLAESYDLLPEYGRIERGEGFSRAEAAADRAIQLDPNLAAGHRAKAFALFYWDWDIPASDVEFRRALALDPNNVETHHWYATTLFSQLKGTQAMAEIDEALRLDPTSAAIQADDAFLHASFFDNREANVKTLRNLVLSQPNFVKPSRFLANFDFQDENYPSYIADLRTAADISHDPDEEALADATAQGWARGGKAGLMNAIVQAELPAFSHGTASGYMVARAYLREGRPKEALPYFKAALDRSDINLMTITECDCLHGLENDAAYALFLRQIRERMHLGTSTSTETASAGKAEPPHSLAVKAP